VLPHECWKHRGHPLLQPVLLEIGLLAQGSEWAVGVDLLRGQRAGGADEGECCESAHVVEAGECAREYM
jgi:hypothetical protein